MRILRLKDRVSIDLEDVKFKLAPISFEQEAEINSCKKIEAGEERIDYSKRVFLLLKFSVKGIEGLKTYDDKKYKPSFDDNGNLTDDSVNDILRIPVTNGVIKAIYALQSGNIDKIEANEVEIEVGK